MNLTYLSQVLGLPQYPTVPIIERPPIITPNPNVTVIPKNMIEPQLDGQLPLPVAPPPYLMPTPVQPDIADVLPDYPSIPNPTDGAADVPPPPSPSPDVLPYDNQAVVANPPGLLQEPAPEMPPPIEERSVMAPAAGKPIGAVNPFSMGLSLLADSNRPAPRPAPPAAVAYRPQMVSVDNLMKLYKGGLL